MMKIELNKIEYVYLCQASFLSDKIQSIFSFSKQQEDVYLLKLSKEKADEVRDILGERLQFAGFDEKYNLTQEGKILESLIDKFLVK
jgi:hypothetical protein